MKKKHRPPPRIDKSALAVQVGGEWKHKGSDRDVPKHREWIRIQSCAIYGLNGHICGGRMQACHVRNGTDGGTGQKPHDKWCWPGCATAHAEQHQIGEESFQAKYRVNLKELAAMYWGHSPYRTHDQ